MNPVQVHLMLTHVPIVGTFIGFLTLVGSVLFRSHGVKVAALIILLISAMTTVPVLFSGELSEDTVAQIAGISESDIEAHEEAAKPYFMIQMALLLVAAFTLTAHWLKWKVARYTVWAVIFISLLSVLLSYYVGNTGGHIRHPEKSSQVQSGGHTTQETDDD